MLYKIVVAIYMYCNPSEYLSQYSYGIHSAVYAYQFMKFYVVLKRAA
jgi:hypothetical protein